MGSQRVEHDLVTEQWHQNISKMSLHFFLFTVIPIPKDFTPTWGVLPDFLHLLLFPLVYILELSVHSHHFLVQFSSVAQLCPTLCDPMNRSTPDLPAAAKSLQTCPTLWDPIDGSPVHHQLPESTQTHVHWVGDAIQPSDSLSSPSPPALNLPQHEGLFRWVSSSHQVAKVLEFQL